jgi:hypothetical protein
MLVEVSTSCLNSLLPVGEHQKSLAHGTKSLEQFPILANVDVSIGKAKYTAVAMRDLEDVSCISLIGGDRVVDANAGVHCATLREFGRMFCVYCG